MRNVTTQNVTMRTMVAQRLLVLGLLCGGCGLATTANAQGLWLGGFGGPVFYSGLAPYGFTNLAVANVVTPIGFGYPAVVRPVYVARPVIAPVVTPVVSTVVTPVYRPRPAVAVPLNRAYRRAWRRGW